MGLVPNPFTMWFAVIQAAVIVWGGLKAILGRLSLRSLGIAVRLSSCMQRQVCPLKLKADAKAPDLILNFEF